MNEEISVLTRQEIGDAIVNYIGTFKKGKMFFPYCVSGTDQELHIPESVMFVLSFVPRGTRSENAQHKL